VRVTIVWTAVTAAVFTIASVVSAVLDSTNFVISFGLAAVASATLAARER
jgi:hypothetical protein